MTKTKSTETLDDMQCPECKRPQLTAQGFLPCSCTRLSWQQEKFGIPKRFWKANFTAPKSKGQRSGLNLAKKFVQQFKTDPKGIYFFGPQGSGKTYVAAAIANVLLLRPRTRVAWFSCQELIIDLTNLIGTDSYSDFAGEVMRQATQAHLLVLDDLGAERDSEFSANMIATILRRRDDAMKPVIITSNWAITRSSVCKETLKDRGVDDRIISRLKQMCDECAILGPDLRIAGGEAA